MTIANPFAEFETYFWPLVASGTGLVAGMLVRRAVLPLISRAAAKSSWTYDDALVEAARNPVLLWGALGGLFVGTRILPFSPETQAALGTAFLVLGILSVTWFLARFAGLAVGAWSARGGIPGVSLIANVVRLAVGVTGVLVLLQTLGISITPIVTALGVGGLAVALALQDTLGNLFSGLRILASGKIRPGDYVRLENGLEGFVQDVSWGQTTVRQTANNLVIVPNAKLAQAITTNFSLPGPEQAVSVGVGVAYGSDLDHVERVALDVARGVQAEVEGAVRGFAPVVRFHTLGDSAIQLNVVLQAETYDQQHLVRSEAIRRLSARFRAEGIEIPFPVRTVHVRQR